MSACRSCGAPIIWAITAKGKRMPLDVEASPDGNVVIRWRRGDHGEDLADVLAGDRLDEARARGHLKLHLSHHVTCPHGRAWRRT